ncbi:uncharacterized protein LOC123264693 isoform X1 [Cotesia glomerata]|uniref:Transcription factor Adf-1 n=1 Tax=Cotesia glomerata TaxID=32391 RepID=A0AAV7IY22_COTGL|nr:uncharacterized protein LOC123264693 isoform X1 [Cotesia glomerata]KAH0560243.1 hypothetical protein KQX54_002821 [Cotesia glomerata]
MMDQYKIDTNQLISEIHKRPALWNNKDVLYHNRDSTNSMWTELSSMFKCPKAVLKSKWKGLRDTFRGELKKEQTPCKSKYSTRNRAMWTHYKNLLFLKDQMLPRPPIWEREDNKNNNYVKSKTYCNNNNHKQLKKLFNIVIERKNLSSVNGQSVNKEELAEDIVKKPIKINLTTPDNEPSSRTMHPVIATPDNEYVESIVKKEPIDIVDNGEYRNNIADNYNNEEERETSGKEEIFETVLPEQVFPSFAEASMADQNRQDDNYHFLMSLLPHIKTLPAERRMLLRIQMQELVYKEVYKKNINTDC